MEELLVLGGGASGLSLSLLTGSSVLEKSSAPGGHAVSTIADGYTFDRGPHIMFSRSKFLLDCMIASLGENVHTCTRNNKVHVNGALGKYPIENDLAAYGPSLSAELLIDFVAAASSRSTATPPTNLAEWFEVNFGRRLTDLYFRPYNEKVWKTKLEDLSMTWSERIPMPPVEDVVRGAVGVPTEGYLHQLHYQYPKFGGYSALMDSWASGVSQNRLHLDAEVKCLRSTGDCIEVDVEGSVLRGRHVVSTLPLRTLVEVFPGIPTGVRDAVSQLRTNATIVITVGFRGHDPNQWTAVYVPDPDFLPNRLSWPAVFSPNNAPDGSFSMQAEIVCSRLDDLAHLDDHWLVNHVVTGARERGLVPPDAELDRSFVERYPLAYVVYLPGYETLVETIRAWFASRGVHIHGRFGSHNYLNVDGCLGESIRLAQVLGYQADEHHVLSVFSALGR